MAELMEKVSDFKNKVLCLLKREKDEFKKLSKAEKRVAVAEDVIAQIRLERYIPESGTYVEIDKTDKVWEKNRKLEEAGKPLIDVDEQPVDVMLAQGMVQCTVCAKGAMFMSHIRKDSNTCTVDSAKEGDDEQEIENRLTDLFSEEQLDLIESAFESNADHYDHEGHDDFFDKDGVGIAEKAADFGSKYSDDQKRLISIMKNIIKNKGTFKP